MRKAIILFVFSLCANVAGQESGSEVAFPDLLNRMIEMDWLWMPPAEGERCIQFSSYDRNSEKGVGVQEAKPWDPEGWYANMDRDNYIRKENRDGQTEYVMAEVDGPGAIVRIWSANPSGILFFYLDDAKEPTWSAGFKELTSGEVDPFTEPMAGIRGRGYNCHAPIPFSRRIKVTCSENDHHYQVNIRIFPKGTRVESFHPDQLDRYADRITSVRERLVNPPPADQVSTIDRTGTLSMNGDPNDPSDWGEVEIPLEGPMVVHEIAVKLTPSLEGNPDRPDLLRRILFCIELDGRRTVRVPFGDFFGSAPAFKPYQAYPLGVAEDGWGFCRFPIPVPHSGKISLVADGPLREVRYDFKIKYEKRAIPINALAFHASWHIRKKVRTRPFSDFRVLNAQGPGRFVGCTLVLANPSRFWWGEGDEKIFVDGESFPSTFGTGTEDYFGYAWADPNPFSSPYHAQPQCDGPENFGYTCLNRFQIPDMIPFQTSLLFDLEIWHWRDVYMDYATTAYWYGRPGAASGLPPVPDPDYRKADKIEPENIFTAKGAVEGEAMKVLSLTAGKTETPYIGWYSDRRWSGLRHLWWQDCKPGDKLTLEVPVEEEGLYQVDAVFTRARDYGIIQVWLNGEAIGDPIDLFTLYVVESTKRMTIGRMLLPKGKIPLTLEITGKNEKAQDGFMVGLDYLRLTRL